MDRKEKIAFLKGLQRKDPEALDRLKQLREEWHSAVSFPQLIAAFYYVLNTNGSYYDPCSNARPSLNENDLAEVIETCVLFGKKQSVEEASTKSLDIITYLSDLIEDERDFLTPYLEKYKSPFIQNLIEKYAGT